MSSKFRIKLKLQGLELEVEGSREDIPQLTRNVSAQLAGMLLPATNIVEGKAPASLGRDAIDGNSHIIEQEAPPRRRGRARRATSAGAEGTNGKGKAIVWNHDANAWGTPLQTWKAVDKAIWLLYVANKSGAANEMSVMQM